MQEPTQDGYYWTDYADEPQIVEVIEGIVHFVGGAADAKPVSQIDAHWVGPLQPPSPVEFRYGYRPRSDWGSDRDEGLPAPYAIGDVVEVPRGVRALQRMRGAPPGRYEISAAYSIARGDGWYFRLRIQTPSFQHPEGYENSDRLHVVYGERMEPEWRLGEGEEPTAPDDVDWLAQCRLIETADPEGLALRKEMLAAGWQPPPE